MNYTNRFSGKGDIYEKARPKYAEELFNYMKNTLSLNSDSIFADVGSGTGIFTEQLLNCGYSVYAVEPNCDMRKKAEEKLSHNNRFHSVNGTDSATTLENNCVDYITAAQAFHWFNADTFKKECKRILKPGGKIIIVYNSRDTNAECTKELAKLRKKFNPEFHGFSNGISEESCLAFFDNKCDIFKCDNSITYDRQGYINRLLSSSYSLKDTDPLFSEYMDNINALFNKFAVDDKITVPTNTIAYIG